MEIKRITISDGTALPAAEYNAIKDGDAVLLGLAAGSNVYSPLPEHWGNASLEIAHRHLADNWDAVPDQGMIDAKALRDAEAEAKAAAVEAQAPTEG